MIKVFRFLLSIIFFLVMAAGCNNKNDEGEATLEPVWQDEFSIDGSIDRAKWTYDLGTGIEIFGRPGWGNNELQYYTDRPENVRVEDGELLITARRESFNNSSYTSARILTKGLFARTYGRFEARILLPFGRGIWPAFWLLGNDSNGTVSWPDIGEIDIMEYRGQEPQVIHGSVHGPGYSGGNAVSDRYVLTNSRFDTEYHVFAVEWGPDFIKYYVDEILYNTITPEDVNGDWVFNDNSFYILLNVAVGGSFVGPPNSGTPFPQTMKVDYVRVYAD